jgi:hypothetical protein
LQITIQKGNVLLCAYFPAAEANGGLMSMAMPQGMVICKT